MTNAQNVPISKRLVLINSASGVLTRLLTVGVFAWAIQHLMKRIPEEELALLPLVMSVAVMLPLLQTMLTAGLSRHVTAAYAVNNLSRVTEIVSSQFPLLMAAAVAVLFVGGLLSLFIDQILDIPAAYVGQMQFMLVLVTARIAIGMCVAPLHSGLFARQRFVVQNVLEIVGSLIRIILMLGLILGLGPKVQWVVVAMVASQLFVVLASTAISMHDIPALRFRLSSFRWETFRENTSFAWWSFLVEVAYVIRRAADAPILYALASATAVNNFFLGALVDTQIREMTMRGSVSLLPVFTAMHAHGQEERLAKLFLRAGRIALWIAMFVATPLILFSYDLFELYLGSEYKEHIDAATAMILLLLGYPFMYPTVMFQRIAHARGNIRTLSIQTVAGQICNLALTLVFVGLLHLGAVGSASATLIVSVVVNAFFHWPLALGTLRVSWGPFVNELLLPGLLPALATTCTGWVFMLTLAGNGLASTAIGLSLCAAVYLLVVVLALKPADRADLARIRQAVRV